MNQVNGGTRTMACPEGRDPAVWTPWLLRARRRERRSNMQAAYVAELCIKLHSLGVLLSIRKPGAISFVGV